MRLLDLTLDSPAENLALDEALLLTAEESGEAAECLRVWEPLEPFVVVGSSSHVAKEVDDAETRRRSIPILRRPSGGAAIVSGPGCLMYSLVLSYQLRPQLRSIEAAHRFVLGAVANALRPLVPNVERQGTSDLAVGGQKFSGNSVRCKREHLLYHGTLLYNFPLDLIQQCLKMPPRTPEYRGGREHQTFCMNLPISGPALRQAITTAFDAQPTDPTWPREMTQQLVRDKYSRDEWNLRT